MKLYFQSPLFQEPIGLHHVKAWLGSLVLSLSKLTPHTLHATSEWIVYPSPAPRTELIGLCQRAQGPRYQLRWLDALPHQPSKCCEIISHTIRFLHRR